jgi:hypothetical protein
MQDIQDSLSPLPGPRHRSPVPATAQGHHGACSQAPATELPAPLTAYPPPLSGYHAAATEDR